MNQFNNVKINESNSHNSEIKIKTLIKNQSSNYYTQFIIIPEYYLTQKIQLTNLLDLIDWIQLNGIKLNLIPIKNTYNFIKQNQLLREINNNDIITDLRYIINILLIYKKINQQLHLKNSGFKRKTDYQTIKNNKYFIDLRAVLPSLIDALIIINNNFNIIDVINKNNNENVIKTTVYNMSENYFTIQYTQNQIQFKDNNLVKGIKEQLFPYEDIVSKIFNIYNNISSNNSNNNNRSNSR
jgi:hypothetical protein